MGKPNLTAFAIFGVVQKILECFHLCSPYGAKTTGVSLYPPLVQWATVVYTPMGYLCHAPLGATQQTGSNERRHFHPREATNLVVVNLPTA